MRTAKSCGETTILNPIVRPVPLRWPRALQPHRKATAAARHTISLAMAVHSVNGDTTRSVCLIFYPDSSRLHSMCLAICSLQSSLLPQAPRLMLSLVRRNISNMLQLQTARNKLQSEYTELPDRLRHCRKAAQHRRSTVTKRLARGRQEPKVLRPHRRGFISRATRSRDRAWIQASLR
jgi:hypothetical protein